MRQLEGYFKPLFSSNAISDAKLYHFATDHFAKLNKQNSFGEYYELIKETKLIIDQFAQFITLKTKTEMKKSKSTKDMGSYLREFKELVNRFEGLTRAIYTKKGEEYTKVFPNGLTEYSKASLKDVDILGQRLELGAFAMNDTISHEIKSDIRDFMITFRKAKQSHECKKLDYKNTLTLRREVRRKLDYQLYKNLLFIAGQNIGNTKVVELFFDQDLLD